MYRRQRCAYISIYKHALNCPSAHLIVFFFFNLRASSHVKDILPSTQPIPDSSDRVSLESEDAIGDHLRIWSSLQTSLVIRRVISDINIKSAIQAHGANKESSVPFLDCCSTRENLEKQAGDYEDKWLKDCVFMWLDDVGKPRGYG